MWAGMKGKRAGRSFPLEHVTSSLLSTTTAAMLKDQQDGSLPL
jgi:hypothetical protein